MIGSIMSCLERSANAIDRPDTVGFIVSTTPGLSPRRAVPRNADVGLEGMP